MTPGRCVAGMNCFLTKGSITTLYLLLYDSFTGFSVFLTDSDSLELGSSLPLGSDFSVFLTVASAFDSVFENSHFHWMYLSWQNNAETWLGMIIWSSGAAQGARQLTNHIVASKLLSQMLPILWILCSSCVFRPLHGRTPLWRRCGMACATTIFVNFFFRNICQKLVPRSFSQTSLPWRHGNNCFHDVMEKCFFII